MPIIGKTDESALAELMQNSRKGILPIGKLRKGGEKRGGQWGEDLPYFRFTSQREAVKDAFYKVYGPKPEAVEIMLVSNDPNMAFETWRESWSASIMDHRCDGKTTNMRYDKARKTYTRDPIPCPGGCKEVGRLSFILPRLVMQGFPGLVVMETHSDYDIRNIWNVLTYYTKKGTEISQIFWNLYRNPTTVSVPMGEKRVNQVKHLVYLEPLRAYVMHQMQGAVIESGIVIDGFALESGQTDLPTLPSGIVPDEPDDFEEDAPATQPVISIPTAPVKQAAVNQKPEKPRWTLESISDRKTNPKNGAGTRFIDMTDPQLRKVIELTNNQETKDMAEWLLSIEPDSETMKRWQDLQAEAKNVNDEKGDEIVAIIDPGSDIKRAELLNLIIELHNQIKDAKAVPF